MKNKSKGLKTYPKYYVKSKYDIFQATGHLTLVSPSSVFWSVSIVMMVSIRCLMGSHFNSLLCTSNTILISYSYIFSCLILINRNEIGIKIVFKIFFVMFFYVIVFSVARIWDSWVTSLSHSCIRGCIQGFCRSRLIQYMQTYRMKTD